MSLQVNITKDKIKKTISANTPDPFSINPVTKQLEVVNKTSLLKCTAAISVNNECVWSVWSEKWSVYINIRKLAQRHTTDFFLPLLQIAAGIFLNYIHLGSRVYGGGGGK
jgi:hypothetical protein